MALTFSNPPEDSMIADALDTFLSGRVELDDADITIGRLLDVRRQIENMTIDHVYLDVFEVGMSATRRNRRDMNRQYEVHLGARSKVSKPITEAKINYVGNVRQLAQTLIEDSGRILTLADSQVAHLIESTPFAPYVREALWQDGVFVSPVKFTWAILS